MGSQATAAAPSSAYRYDLDGLRGLAIALVVFFHIFVGRVSGGVDVFLLLSGYFFLGSQLRYAFKPHPSLNPWWPFWRTARRLVPSLALVIAATVTAALFLVPEMMNEELTRQVTASILYFQNWELITQGADYSAASQDTSPLQHLWSMAIQGQFYIGAIALATVVALIVSRGWVSAKAAKNSAIVVLALVTLASFLWAARYGIIGTAESYYSTFSRAWELGLGALLALLPTSWTLPRRFSGIGAGCGVILIASTGVIISTTLAFPGPLSLLPLTGATLVVLAGSNTRVNSALASKPLLWLGDIAYPLYLWHWPLLIVATVLGGFATPPLWIGVVIVFASLALAHITHQLVELPLKQHSKRPHAGEHPLRRARLSLVTPKGAARAAGGVVVASLAVMALCVQPVWRSYVEDADRLLDPLTYPGATVLLGANAPDVRPEPDPRLISGMYPPTGVDGCLIYIPQGPDEFPGPECVYGDLESDVVVVLAGGSHAEPLTIPLDILGKQHGFKVVPLMRQECPTVLDDDDLVSPVCAEWSRNAVNHIIELNPELVISTSTRPPGFAGDAGMSVDTVPESYRALWDVYRENNIAFLGFRDNPWIFDAEGNPLDPNECIVSGKPFEDCSMPREEVYGPTDPAAEYLDGSDNLFSVDTARWYCPDEVCPPAVGNVFVYRDQNHISNAYATTLTPLIWNELQKVLGQLGIDYLP